MLLNEETSIFTINDIVSKKHDTEQETGKKSILAILRRLVPTDTKNFKAAANFEKIIRLVCAHSQKPLVLLVGAGTLGVGVKALVENKNITCIETDVIFGPRTQIICDAHNLPFASESLDGIVLQAVLEHVMDPYHCVEEARRVLVKNGIVYNEVPFMQQTHHKPYDFTRFTDLGHRRIFKQFQEIDRGIVVGPAVAFAWSFRYLFMSITDKKILRKLIGVFCVFLTFWMKYLDYYFIRKSSSYEAASGFYFLGRKSEQGISDKELLQLYRGGK